MALVAKGAPTAGSGALVTKAAPTAMSGMEHSMPRVEPEVSLSTWGEGPDCP